MTQNIFDKIFYLVGSVFPSGCHRHPARLMPGHLPHPPLPQHRLRPCGEHDNSPGSAQLLSFKHTDTCHSENSTLHRPEMTVRTNIFCCSVMKYFCLNWVSKYFHSFQYRYSQQYPSFSENSSETDSVTKKDKPRLLPELFINKSEMAAKAKSFDGLAALLNKTSFKENANNKSRISFNESIVPRRQKFRVSQAPVAAGSKESANGGKLSVAKSQILRRHTLHDKSSHRQQTAVHVHSWHKQVTTIHLIVAKIFCIVATIFLQTA